MVLNYILVGCPCLNTLVLKLEIEPSSPNSFGRSFQSLATANLNDDYPIAEDTVSPKSNREASLKDIYVIVMS